MSKATEQVWWHAFRRRVIKWEIDDRALGSDRRNYREKHGISLRELGREIGFSAVYLSDLELGRRPWSEQLIYRHEVALTACIDRRKKQNGGATA